MKKIINFAFYVRTYTDCIDDTSFAEKIAKVRKRYKYTNLSQSMEAANETSH